MCPPRRESVVAEASALESEFDYYSRISGLPPGEKDYSSAKTAGALLDNFRTIQRPKAEELQAPLIARPLSGPPQWV